MPESGSCTSAFCVNDVLSTAGANCARSTRYSHCLLLHVTNKDIALLTNSIVSHGEFDQERWDSLTHGI